MKETPLNYCDFWDEEDVSFLRENYKTMNYEKIGRVIGRTEKAIASKARVLRLIKRKFIRQTNYVHPKTIIESYSNGKSIDFMMSIFSVNRNIITEIINQWLSEYKEILYDDDPEDEMITLKPIEDFPGFIKYANKMTVSHDNLAAGRDEPEVVGRC